MDHAPQVEHEPVVVLRQRREAVKMLHWLFSLSARCTQLYHGARPGRGMAFQTCCASDGGSERISSATDSLLDRGKSLLP